MHVLVCSILYIILHYKLHEYVIIVCLLYYVTSYPPGPRTLGRGPRKGTNGVSSNVVAANAISFDRCTFWVPICQTLSKAYNCAYLFTKSVKIHYFCSDPMSVDPIRPQPNPKYE